MPEDENKDTIVNEMPTSEPANIDAPEKTDVQNVEQAVPTTEQPAPKKKFKLTKKFLIIAISILIVVLIGGGASAYQFWYQNPKKILSDAVSNVMMSNGVSGTTEMTFDITDKNQYSYEGIDMGSIKKITLNTSETVAPSVLMDMTIEFEYNEETYSVNAKGMYDSAGNAYFQLNQVLDSIKKAFGDQIVSDEVKEKISSLEGKWVKYTLDDMRDGSEEMADAAQCMLDAYKEINKDKAYMKELFTVYEKAPFFVVDETTVKNQDGKYSMEIKMDADNFVEFANKTDGLASTQKMSDCYKNMPGYEESDDVSKDDVESLDGMTMTVWVDQWSHQLKQVDMTYYSDDADYKIKFESSSNVVVDNNLKIDIPSDTMTMEEWNAGVEEIMEVVMGAYMEDVYGEYYSDYYSDYYYDDGSGYYDDLYYYDDYYTIDSL